MKKIRKISIIFIILIMIFMLNFSYAQINTSDFKTDIQDKDVGKVVSIGNQIIGILQLFGSILSVIVLIIIGIKYMLGSVEEKAQYKELMMPYIIGAVLIFGIVNILAIIESIMAK